MTLINAIAWFFAGAFLANAIPHLVAGLMGEAFQSPFAKPRGKGLSSSRVNVLWGFVNLALGWLLSTQVGAFDVRRPDHVAVMLGGALLIGLLLARYVGRLHGGDRTGGDR